MYLSKESQRQNALNYLTSYSETCILHMPTVLTGDEARAFSHHLQLVCDTPAKRIVLDFGPTQFVNSEGIGAIVEARRRCTAAHITLTCWSVSSDLRTAFLQAGLSEQLAIQSGTDAILPQIPKGRRSRPHPSTQSTLKRLMDIAGAMVGLAILGMLFIPIAALIRWDSPGPILFSQVRRGYLGRPFRIWKFRSMVTNASQLQHLVTNQASGAFFKCDVDPRVTQVGRFLRKTSLDELPQFWNVLKGDMSLVGTRPPTATEVEQYHNAEWRRLDVKPGLTGVWQVSGRSNVKSFDEVVALDLKYQRRWNIVYDLKIILKTVRLIFSKHSGAM